MVAITNENIRNKALIYVAALPPPLFVRFPEGNQFK